MVTCSSTFIWGRLNMRKIFHACREGIKIPAATAMPVWHLCGHQSVHMTGGLSHPVKGIMVLGTLVMKVVNAGRRCRGQPGQNHAYALSFVGREIIGSVWDRGAQRSLYHRRSNSPGLSKIHHMYEPSAHESINAQEFGLMLSGVGHNRDLVLLGTVAQETEYLSRIPCLFMKIGCSKSRTNFCIPGPRTASQYPGGRPVVV